MSVLTNIATDLTRIIGAKSNLKTSIEAKGVTVPSETPLDNYAALVDQIQQGGGGHTGTVDTAGLQALGWDSYDIQWLQDHVWWDAEDDAEWAVTEANKAFGPAGATPLTWNTRANVKYNPDVRYLPKLTLPSNKNSMYNEFNAYVFLVAIPTHGWNMSAVTNFASLFYNCVHLRSVGDVSYWVTTTTTQINQMFYSCVELEEIDTSHWNTSNCTDMSQAFQNCIKLKNIDISVWSFAKVTTCSQLFASCYLLESVKLPSAISAPALTSAPNMFLNCVSLKEFAINLTAASLTNINNFLSGCLTLQKATINITSSAITTMNYVFGSCWEAEEVDLSALDTTNVDQSGMGGNYVIAPFGTCFSATVIKLGLNFFNGTFTTLYAQQANSWTRDSIYESLYTNQTTRDSNSNAVTVKLATNVYDSLSAQDISDIATKNITLTRG